MSKHFSDAKNPNVKSTLHKDIRKGKDNFSWTILETVSSEKDLDKRESYWIDHYRKSGYNLYNRESGGKSGYKLSEESKRLMSKAKKGKPLTEEHKRKIIESKKKNGTLSVSFQHSDDAKKVMSEKAKGHKRTVGSNNASAKINESLAETIIRQLISGDRVSDIAREHGLSVGIVSDINRRKTWRHVVVQGYEHVGRYKQ